MGHQTEAPSSSTIVLAGGGLANSLIAYRLATTRPDVQIRLVEAGPALGGRHTWSYFASDLDAADDWIAPFIVKSWDEYEVRFPKRRRTLPHGYRSVTSERLHEVVSGVLGDGAVLGASIVDLDATSVVLADGRRISGDAVIDGRGPSAMPDLVLGYQKFLGLTLRLGAPHGLKGPVVMDATVDQKDGYRFVYVLPWDAMTVLIEDTRYSDGAHLDAGEMRESVLAYATACGWTWDAVLAEEEGVLPVALEGDIEAHWRRAGTVGLSGLRAVLFHPTTGYSLPDAVAFASEVAALPSITAASVAALSKARSIGLWKTRGIFRLVNRMLFRAALPGQRYRVLERFYGLPEPLIQRFYGARLTYLDKVRLLSGKPPVPFFTALTCIGERGRS
jgi:lycopene beta-cyclase